MSLVPCSMCGQKPKGKIASLYNAWFNANGDRTAWKQKMCFPCLNQTLISLLRSAADASEDVTACPACGVDSSSDLDPIYSTIYVPKQEAREYSLTTCSPCAAKLRVLLQRGAVRLADRQNGGDAQDEWAMAQLP